MVTAEAEPRAEIFEKMYVGLCFACVIFSLEGVVGGRLGEEIRSAL